MTCFRQRQVEETRIGSHVEGEGVVGLQEVCSSSSLDRERHRAVEVSRFNHRLYYGCSASTCSSRPSQRAIL